MKQTNKQTKPDTSNFAVVALTLPPPISTQFHLEVFQSGFEHLGSSKGVGKTFKGGISGWTWTMTYTILEMSLGEGKL